MYGWVGGPFLSKLEPAATAYDEKVTTRQTEDKAMQQSGIDKNTQRRGQNKKKLTERIKRERITMRRISYLKLQAK